MFVFKNNFITITFEIGQFQTFCKLVRHFSKSVIFIGYWLDMEIYVRVLVQSNIAQRQERNITYAPE